MYYYNGKADRQYIYIATPERRLMGVLNGVEETSARIIKNAQNTFELSFTVYKYVYGKPSAYYESIEELMQLYVDGVWYIINDPPRIFNDGLKSEYIEVTAESAEIQLQHFDLKTFYIGMGVPESYEMQYYNKYKDTPGYKFKDSWPVVRFYDNVNPELSLLHLILYHAGLIPVDITYDENGNQVKEWTHNKDKGLWKIGKVDGDPKYRPKFPPEYEAVTPDPEHISEYYELVDGVYEKTQDTEVDESKTYYVIIDKDVYFLSDETYAFQIDNQDVYSFLTQDVSQAFSCIFTFDTVNRTINATYVDHLGTDTNVYIGWRNIQDNLQGTRADQLYTAASVSGGEGIDNILYANFGSNEIEDYSYFMDTRYVSQDLIDKYNAWVEYREMMRPYYVQARKNWFEADSAAKELMYRVPTDGVENDWSGMTADELQTAYNNYASMAKGLESKYVDEFNKFDIDALKASPDWDLYEQIMNYIIPSIIDAIQKTSINTEVELLYSAKNTEGGYSGVPHTLNKVPDVKTIDIYYYESEDSEAKKIARATYPNDVLVMPDNYYVVFNDEYRLTMAEDYVLDQEIDYYYNPTDNTITVTGELPLDRIYISYNEQAPFRNLDGDDLLLEFGTGNLLQNPYFTTTNSWNKKNAQTGLRTYSSDSLPTYGAIHYMIASHSNPQSEWGVYQNKISVLPDNTYTFSVWVKTPIAGTCRLGWSLEDVDFDEMTLSYSDVYTVTDSWQRIFVHIPVSSETHTPLATVGIFCDETNTEIHICAPMLELGELSSPSSFGYFQQDDEIIQSYKTDWKLYGTIELQNLIDNYAHQADLLESYAYNDTTEIEFSEAQRLYQQYLDYMRLYNEAIDALATRQGELAEKEEIRTNALNEANEIAEAVARKNFFTPEDENVLLHLYKHTDYVNENIVVTYGMDTATEVDQQWALWYDATDNLYASAHPQYTWEDKIDNILGLEEFKDITTPLDLFSFVHVEIDDDGTYATLRLIGVTYNPLIYQGDYSLKFSTITSYKNRRDDFSQLIGNAVKSAKNAIVGGASSEVTTYSITPEFIKQLLNNASFQKGAGQIANVNSYGGVGGSVSFDNVSANTLFAKLLKADEGYFDTLEAKVITAESITTTLFNAEQAYIDTINSKFVTAERVKAAIGQFEEGDFDTLNARYASVDFANIDTANIDVTKTSELIAKIGMVTDLAVVDGHITGKLSAVEIDGDVLNVHNLKADSMFLKGDDGLYYALNVNALGEATVESLSYYEQHPVGTENPKELGWYEYDEVNDEYYRSTDTSINPDKTYYGYWQDDLKEGLHGDNIIAGTITADKIYVSDLSAFEATIGGLMVDADAIHTIGKNSVDSSTPGLYMDNLGQFNTGDSNNFIASWYDEVDQSWKVAIRADEISFGSGESVKDVVTNAANKVDDLEERMNSGEFKGEDGVAYYIVSSVQNLLQIVPTQSELIDSDGNKIIDSSGNLIVVQGSSFMPSSVTFYAKMTIGSNSPSDYEGRFIIDESLDGDTWSIKYTSGNDESEHDYIPSSEEVRFIRCTLYESGGTDVQLNTQTIFVIADSKDCIVSTVSCYYRSDDVILDPNSIEPTSDTDIGTSSSVSGFWEYVMPQPKKNAYFYTCEKYIYADGNIGFSTVREIANATYTSKWVSSANNVYIDGGALYANSVSASAIDANSGNFNIANIPNLTAEKIKTSVISAINDDYNEGVTIEADRVNIEGATIFSSGRLSTTSLNNTYDGKNTAKNAIDALKTDLASDTGTTVINGGHITTGTIDASKATITNIDAGNINTGTLNADIIETGSLDIDVLNSTSKSKILNSNIKIGGSNLITGTNTCTALVSTSDATWEKRGWRTAGSASGVTKTSINITDCPNNSVIYGWNFTADSITSNNYGSGGVIGQNAVPILSNTEYTLSCYAKGTGKLLMFYGVSSFAPSDGSGKIDVNSTSWTKYHITFTTESATTYVSASNTTNVFFGIGYGTNIDLSICGMKLEIGNKATDWTAAPEDYLWAVDVADAAYRNSEANSSYLNGGQNEARIYLTDVDTAFDESAFLNKVNNESGQYILTNISNSWVVMKDDLNVPSSNLLQKSAIKIYASTGSGESLNTDNYLTSGDVTYTRNAANNKGFYITQYSLFVPNETYILHFYLQQAESSANNITTFFLFAQNPENIAASSLYIDGMLYGDGVNTSYNIDISDHNLHEVTVTFTAKDAISTGTYQGVILQLNKDIANAFTVNITGLKWEANSYVSKWTAPPSIVETVSSLDAYGITLNETAQNGDSIVVICDSMRDLRSDYAAIQTALAMIESDASQSKYESLIETNSLKQEMSDEMSSIKSGVAELSEGYESLSETVGDIGGVVSELSTYMTNIQGALPKYEALTTKIRSDEEGLHVFGVDADKNQATSAEVLVSPDRISLKKSTNVIAWLGDKNNGEQSNYKLYITEAEVSNNVRIGDLAFIPRSNGNMCLKFVGGENALGWRLNASSYSGATNNGECYFFGYDAAGNPADVDGYVYWDNVRIIIPKGYGGANPNAIAPYNVDLYIIYRTSNSTFYNAWLESGTWYGMSYNSNGDPGSKSAFTWSESTDIVIGRYVMPSSEGAITDAELYSPCKTYSEIIA